MKMRETGCEGERYMGLAKGLIQLWAIGPESPVLEIRHITVVYNLLATL
jgi:hypothetical protein